MHSDVEIVKSRINIVDIVGEYVKLTKAGSSFKACCPFHQEKTPSFNVNEEKQFYHCFGCGAGGDVFSFVMEIENLDFREALILLAQKAGVELQNEFIGSSRESQDKKKNLYNILELATKFYEKQLWNGDGIKKVLPYLRDRGFSDEMIKKFRLGYSPNGWNHVRDFLVEKGFDNEIILQTGIIIKNDRGKFYDRFRNRIMFPISDVLGRVIGFTSRVLPEDNDNQAKYINTPETLLYHKSNVLYGLNHAKQFIKQKDCVVVVEGNMDVIAANDAEIENVIAVSGTAMTQEHIHILKRYTNRFILFFDSDEAGITAARRSALLCLEEDIQLNMVLLKVGKDAADIVKDDPVKLHDIINNAKNVVEVFIDIARNTYDITDPHGKRQAIEFVTELLSHISNEIEREEWISRCAQAFNVEVRLVSVAIKRQVEQHNKELNKTQPMLVKNAQAIHAEQSQMQRIYKSIILMMMAYPHVWEYIYKNRKKYGSVLDQKMITALMREGPECNFSVGEFVSKDSSRESLYKAAMQMQQQYEVEHEEGGSPIEDTETYITIAIENLNKQKMERLVVLMDEAEANGDYDTQKKILKKIGELSQQVINNI